ncbi:bifunctional UDP-sugar hydrolase/5'-nucleotidase [Archangium lipolyticum]|uniref:5'-nucleotidase n=1 Tax=Archangium lipolyticum TaxID=2970465 RepID=UPI00214A1521|nr:5'-nucleotidase [Archangium lipolyticum]
MLLLDAGNALFKSSNPGGDPTEKARAQLLLEQMNALGTAAMAVGLRDLTLGTDFLVKATQGPNAKMKLLSANLVDAAGKPLFPASTVQTVNGVKVGLVGISPEGPVATQKGVVGRPPVQAAIAESRRLRQAEKVDVVVVLAAVPYVEAIKLSTQGGDAMDFIVQSHEGRTQGAAQRNDYATLVAPGERGRQLARLELSLDGGKGPFVDLSEADRARENLRILDDNIQQARKRMATMKDEAARNALQEAVANFEARRKVLAAQVGEGTQAARRTHRLTYIQLGSQVADDAELKKRVERIEPPGSASH